MPSNEEIGNALLKSENAYLRHRKICPSLYLNDLKDKAIL